MNGHPDSAGGKDELAYELPELGYGVFSKMLLVAFGEKSEGGGDGFILASDIAQYVKRKVSEGTHSKQNPRFQQS